MNKLLPALLLTASFAIGATAAMAQVPTGTPPMTTGAPTLNGPGGNFPHPENGRERHPEIRKAMHHLDEAKRNLQSAAHDYDGHRAQAVQLIDQAEAQLHQAEASDRR